MGLLGMLAAGGAMGARGAANAGVRAQNELEIAQAKNGMDMDREQLRQEFLNERYKTQRADAREAAKSNLLLEEAKYQRGRSDKITDTEADRAHKMDIERMKESGRDKRSNARIASSGDMRSSGGGKSNSVTLNDGTEFIPNDADSKNAANLHRLGLAGSIQEGYEIIYAQKFSSQAAGTMGGFQSGIIPESRNMSRALLNGSQGVTVPKTERLQFNPKTGGF